MYGFKRKIAKLKIEKVYCRVSALQFGGAAMLTAFIVSKEDTNATVFFMIEIHRMKTANAHLMVCELFFKTSFVFQNLA